MADSQQIDAHIDEFVSRLSCGISEIQKRAVDTLTSKLLAGIYTPQYLFKHASFVTALLAAARNSLDLLCTVNTLLEYVLPELLRLRGKPATHVKVAAEESSDVIKYVLTPQIAMNICGIDDDVPAIDDVLRGVTWEMQQVSNAFPRQKVSQHSEHHRFNTLLQTYLSDYILLSIQHAESCELLPATFAPHGSRSSLPESQPLQAGSERTTSASLSTTAATPVNIKLQTSKDKVEAGATILAVEAVEAFIRTASRSVRCGCSPPHMCALQQSDSTTLTDVHAYTNNKCSKLIGAVSEGRDADAEAALRTLMVLQSEGSIPPILTLQHATACISAVIAWSPTVGGVKVAARDVMLDALQLSARLASDRPCYASASLIIIKLFISRSLQLLSAPALSAPALPSPSSSGRLGAVDGDVVSGPCVPGLDALLSVDVVQAALSATDLAALLPDHFVSLQTIFQQAVNVVVSLLQDPGGKIRASCHDFVRGIEALQPFIRVILFQMVKVASMCFVDQPTINALLSSTDDGFVIVEALSAVWYCELSTWCPAWHVDTTRMLENLNHPSLKLLRRAHGFEHTFSGIFHALSDTDDPNIIWQRLLPFAIAGANEDHISLALLALPVGSALRDRLLHSLLHAYTHCTEAATAALALRHVRCQLHSPEPIVRLDVVRVLNDAACTCRPDKVIPILYLLAERLVEDPDEELRLSCRSAIMSQIERVTCAADLWQPLSQIILAADGGDHTLISKVLSSSGEHESIEAEKLMPFLPLLFHPTTRSMLQGMFGASKSETDETAVPTRAKIPRVYGTCDVQTMDSWINSSIFNRLQGNADESVTHAILVRDTPVLPAVIALLSTDLENPLTCAALDSLSQFIASDAAHFQSDAPQMERLYEILSSIITARATLDSRLLLSVLRLTEAAASTITGFRKLLEGDATTLVALAKLMLVDDISSAPDAHVHQQLPEYVLAARILARVVFCVDTISMEHMQVKIPIGTTSRTSNAPSQVPVPLIAWNSLDTLRDPLICAPFGIASLVPSMVVDKLVFDWYARLADHVLVARRKIIAQFMHPRNLITRLLDGSNMNKDGRQAVTVVIASWSEVFRRELLRVGLAGQPAAEAALVVWEVACRFHCSQVPQLQANLFTDMYPHLCTLSFHASRTPCSGVLRSCDACCALKHVLHAFHDNAMLQSCADDPISLIARVQLIKALFEHLPVSSGLLLDGFTTFVQREMDTVGEALEHVDIAGQGSNVEEGLQLLSTARCYGYLCRALDRARSSGALNFLEMRMPATFLERAIACSVQFVENPTARSVDFVSPLVHGLSLLQAIVGAPIDLPISANSLHHLVSLARSVTGITPGTAVMLCEGMTGIFRSTGKVGTTEGFTTLLTVLLSILEDVSCLELHGLAPSLCRLVAASYVPTFSVILGAFRSRLEACVVMYRPGTLALLRFLLENGPSAGSLVCIRDLLGNWASQLCAQDVSALEELLDVDIILNTPDLLPPGPWETCSEVVLESMGRIVSVLRYLEPPKQVIALHLIAKCCKSANESTKRTIIESNSIDFMAQLQDEVTRIVGSCTVRDSPTHLSQSQCFLRDMPIVDDVIAKYAANMSFDESFSSFCWNSQRLALASHVSQCASTYQAVCAVVASSCSPSAALPVDALVHFTSLLEQTCQHLLYAVSIGEHTDITTAYICAQSTWKVVQAAMKLVHPTATMIHSDIATLLTRSVTAAIVVDEFVLNCAVFPFATEQLWGALTRIATSCLAQFAIAFNQAPAAMIHVDNIAMIGVEKAAVIDVTHEPTLCSRLLSILNASIDTRTPVPFFSPTADALSACALADVSVRRYIVNHFLMKRLIKTFARVMAAKKPPLPSCVSLVQLCASLASNREPDILQILLEDMQSFCEVFVSVMRLRNAEKATVVGSAGFVFALLQLLAALSCGKNADKWWISNKEMLDATVQASRDVSCGGKAGGCDVAGAALHCLSQLARSSARFRSHLKHSHPDIFATLSMDSHTGSGSCTTAVHAE